MSNHLKNITLRIWRQAGPNVKGNFENHVIDEITDEASFLEMLDILNDKLVHEGKEAVVFDHDCREGICGTCSLMIDGQAHGPQRGTATCQLHMRQFKSNDTITVEPWRASAFPLIKDLMVDRSAFDRIIESGGYITADTGGAPDASAVRYCAVLTQCTLRRTSETRAARPRAAHRIPTGAVDSARRSERALAVQVEALLRPTKEGLEQLLGAAKKRAFGQASHAARHVAAQCRISRRSLQRRMTSSSTSSPSSRC